MKREAEDRDSFTVSLLFFLVKFSLRSVCRSPGIWSSLHVRPLATEDIWSDILKSISAPLLQVTEVFYGFILCRILVVILEVTETSPA